MLDNASEKKSVSNNGELAQAVVEERSLPPIGKYVPPDSESVDIFKLLDELEDLPEKAKHGWFNSLFGFDSDKFYYLVLKIRASLPDDVKRAHRVARDSERIVDEAKDAAVQQLESGRVEANRILETARTEQSRVLEKAQEDARRIVDQAKLQAAQMVDKSEIQQLATAQAHETIRRAENEANEIRKGADDYARDVLINLEGVMGKAINTIQRGREQLDRVRG